MHISKIPDGFTAQKFEMRILQFNINVGEILGIVKSGEGKYLKELIFAPLCSDTDSFPTAVGKKYWRWEPKKTLKIYQQFLHEN